MPLKVTAVDSPTNLAQERHWAMIRALENPARDERQSCFRTYLALNWQRRRIKTRFKWIEQRFPTPPQRRNNGEIDQLLTTNHLFWPNERRKAASSLPFWLPNPTLPAAKCNPSKPRGGGGGSAGRIRHGTSTEQLARNFISIGSLPYSCCAQKKRASNR